MLNRVVLIGRLTRDPDLKYTPSGDGVCNFTLAVDRPFKTNGEKEADFLNVVTWRKLAELCAEYLKKGRLTAVEGRIQIRSYLPEGADKKVYITEIVADNVRFLESGNQSSGQREPIGSEDSNPFDE
jgi:single-strand DNA-binding protein